MIFKKKKYIIVEFDNKAGAFDFPKRLRVPRIGEKLSMETEYGYFSGYVLDVNTRISQSHTEISIRVGNRYNPLNKKN